MIDMKLNPKSHTRKAKDEIPAGVFMGGDEVPAGTFHGGDEVPPGTFHS